MDYPDFFTIALGGGSTPYPYQSRLATGTWPDILDIPTGLGKTAAVSLAWLYKRGWRPDGTRTEANPDTPRRLIWCLPMRVLVEQTEQNLRAWLGNLGCLGEKAGDGKVSIHPLMGGEDDIKSWAEWPEEDMILVGTQDMLLSRALMRGYAMSRYQWPVQFALLHTDALWVFDEIQLMGAGLPTSTQLEAFRRGLTTAAGSRTLWISATLNRSWLDSVDFLPFTNRLVVQSLDETEKDDPAVLCRRNAAKEIALATTQLDTSTAKGGGKDYVAQLCREVLAAHPGTAPTLVILNNVQRAQDLYTALNKGLKGRESAPGLLLVHSRFRPGERAALNRRIRAMDWDDNLIVVATQALEAGVDISAHTLFAELAPWSSLVQRFGRCNRAGEHPDGRVFWIDIEGGATLSAPYTDEELEAARNLLSGLPSAAPADLPPPAESRPLHQVIRRKDFLELFNTDTDLSGFDADISPWIRDSGPPQVQVFWRDFRGTPGDQPTPARDELCPVSLARLRDHLRAAEGFVWDPLAHRWDTVAPGRLRPGQLLLLRCADGGYSEQLGFRPRYKDKRSPLTALPAPAAEPEDYPSERLTQLGRFVTLAEHLSDAAGEAQRLCDAVGETARGASVVRAARWHDTGKAHPAFQNMLLTNSPRAAELQDRLWAKSDSQGRALYATCGGEPPRVHYRRYFRHELASMLAWLAHRGSEPDADLVAFLIAAHHGRVRMGLRALPGERGPQDDRRFARGVWEGDRLPALLCDGETLAETPLRLDLMELGDGATGASWTTRTQRLLHAHGPFRLAWLEALVRIADWRASRKEQEQ